MNSNIDPIQWFQEQGITRYEIVMSNPWKGRRCFVFWNSDGARHFLKWNDTDENFAHHRYLMEKEEQIYRLLKTTDISPRYIGGDMFVTEYVEGGETLRNKLKEVLRLGNENEALNLLHATFEKWQQFRKVVNRHQEFVEKKNVNYIFNRYLSSLIVSGPIDTKWSRAMFYRNRILQLFFRIRYRKFGKTLLQGYPAEAIHGDFHLNNVMIDENRHVYLLDFESVKTGRSEIELAYFVVQLYQLKEGSDLFSRDVDILVDTMDLVENRNLYIAIKRIFCKAIKNNPRFC